MRVVADDNIPFLQGVLERYAIVDYLPTHQIVANSVRDADALIVRTRTQCNRALLEGSSVRYIGAASIGFDHIDREYCDSHNIFWTNAPGCNSSSVCRYIASALYFISEQCQKELSALTLGVVGVGNVGQKVANFASLIGMNVLLNDPPRAEKEGNGQFVDLDSLLRQSDIITFHVPMTKDGKYPTYHLIDSTMLSKLKPTAWIINSARGGIGDTSALNAALAEKTFAGFVSDVWENEPYIDTNLVEQATIATPHIAGLSIDGKANGISQIVNSIARHFGLPLANWYPTNIPTPCNPLIEIDCLGKSAQTIVKEAILSVYDIAADSEKLKAAPSAFTRQRDEYAPQREYGAYTIRVKNDKNNIASLLQKLNFQIQNR